MYIDILHTTLFLGTIHSRCERRTQVCGMTHSMCDMTEIDIPQTTFFSDTIHLYGVATISMLLKIIGLFCRISSFL